MVCPMSEVLLLVVAIVVVALVVGIGLVSVRTRRRAAAPPPVEAPPVEAPPVEAPSAEAPVEAEAPSVEAPPVEKPEDTRSRLIRLRERLVGSQGMVGRGLLAVLSRDRLAEDDWESIEDTLLRADLGVAPARSRGALRPRLRVEGSEAADPRHSAARGAGGARRPGSGPSGSRSAAPTTRPAWCSWSGSTAPGRRPRSARSLGSW